MKLKNYKTIKLSVYFMKRFSRGFRKYIRKEKARIRKEALTLGEERKMIEQLCQRTNEMFKKKHKDKKVVLSS